MFEHATIERTGADRFRFHILSESKRRALAKRAKLGRLIHARFGDPRVLARVNRQNEETLRTLDGAIVKHNRAVSAGEIEARAIAPIFETRQR